MLDTTAAALAVRRVTQGGESVPQMPLFPIAFNLRAGFSFPSPSRRGHRTI